MSRVFGPVAPVGERGIGTATVCEYTFIPDPDIVYVRPPLTDLVLDHNLPDRIDRLLAAYPITAAGFDPLRASPTVSDLRKPHGWQEVQGALDYLQDRRKTKAGHYTPGSYGLKHQAESWHRKHGRQVYVSNGAFLVAALMRGFSLFQRPGDTLNRAVGLHRADIVTRDEKRAWFGIGRRR